MTFIFLQSLGIYNMNHQISKIFRVIFVPIFILMTLTACKKDEKTTLLDTRNLIQGKVVRVADGDTVTLQTKDNPKLKIRLFAIDAPETKQEFGQESKKHLTELLLNKDVSIREIHKDQYGRTVAIIFLGDKDINLEQLKGGYAWYYRAFKKYQDTSDANVYDQAERDAKSSKTGLWKSFNALAPWEFRKQKRLEEATE